MSIQIGDYMFREGEYTEEGVDLILKLRNRLFKGIAIADLDVEVRFCSKFEIYGYFRL